jgi:hypothetical protein
MNAEGLDYDAGFVRMLRLEGGPVPFSWLKTDDGNNNKKNRLG